MSDPTILILHETVRDPGTIDLVLTALRAGGYRLVQPNGTDAGIRRHDLMVPVDDPSLPAIETPAGEPRRPDPVGTAILCLSSERRGMGFLVRMRTILEAVVLSTGPSRPGDPRGTAHAPSPWNDLTVRSWNDDGAACAPDDVLEAMLRSMTIVDERRESPEEAPGVTRVLALSCVHRLARYADGTPMATLRGLAELERLAADPTYGRTDP